MSVKQQEEHERLTKHTTKHQNCTGFCAWGFGNPKNRPHSGATGKPGRRKANGWRKGWMKAMPRKDRELKK